MPTRDDLPARAANARNRLPSSALRVIGPESIAPPRIGAIGGRASSSKHMRAGPLARRLARPLARPVPRSHRTRGDPRVIVPWQPSPPMDPVRLGRQYRALRRRRGWRQVDVASRTGVSKSTIGRIERGEIAGMPLEVLVRVAAVLGARLDVSLRWNGEALDRLLDEDR